MTVEEFLKTNKSISLSAIAKLMWPDNASAPSRLLTKLSDKSNRPFTKADSENALEVLKKLSITINELTI